MIRDTRLTIAERLAHLSEEIRLATVMVVSELLENAIKYGDRSPSAPPISLDVAIANGHVRIEMANATSSLEAVTRLADHVDRLTAASDKTVLWLKRVQELGNFPSDHVGLGLYRVAIEGGFTLQWSYERPLVRVVATRSIP